ncbi:uncharacterized protein VICG_01730 [Vittaforma corneae ATCC 50505]|uniref:Xaa-Pro aminopeptidase n=1 Tax=Vittaforma corneae (strain ATCC 50505) TaxID=993615 RepID=L2GK68_VITCO|nr:uncharacterized protein VICG_01730 [Vittaforma corneae ATCC 50505]ELA41241.1 hypothetical protein VICG_01730 [Vittaforma corneae ATCC 50505]
MTNRLDKLMLGGEMLKLLASFNIDGFITTMQDEHLNEFINDNDNKIMHLTGFTGSAGIAFTSIHEKVLITDGRYYLQAERELRENESKGYRLVKQEDQEEYWKEILKSINSIGVDTRYISIRDYETLKNIFNMLGTKLVHVPDIVLELWKDRPARQFRKIIDLQEYRYRKEVDFDEIVLSLEQCSQFSNTSNSKTSNLDLLFDNEIVKQQGDSLTSIAGESRKDKISRVLETLNEDEILVLTELDTIAWIFNLRGEDIKNNLFFYSFSVIFKEKVVLFTNSDVKLPELQDIVQPTSNETWDGTSYSFEIKGYSEFYRYIESFKHDKKIVISPNTPAFIANKFKNKRITNDIRALQSVKNKMELYGMLRANILDALALIKLSTWIHTASRTEREIAEQLRKIKSENRYFLRTSFDSIVAVGKNGAELHHSIGDTYTAKEKAILIDSGSQYIFGTTDITRTLSTRPDAILKRDYTFVLKATIAPKLLQERELGGDTVDTTARSVLLSEGLTYDSSTGHGVGFGLNVHENPPAISQNGGEILENQVFTIEPGVYREGKYGIRIEDMVYLESLDGMDIVHDLTFAPYQMDMIDRNLLTEDESKYINTKNRKIGCLFMSRIKDKASLKYLIENTKEL